VLEESDFVAGVFEFVDVGPDFRLPRALVGRGLTATGTPGVKGDSWPDRGLRIFIFILILILQFEEDAAHFFDLFIGTENVLVAQQVSKAELAGFEFRFFPGMERPVFGAQWLGRVAGHPENIFVSHTHPSLVVKG